MVNFHDRSSRAGYLVGKVAASGNATSVVGGTLTAGTFDVDGSGLLTFSPPFISAPVVFGSYEGILANTANLMAVQFTGVGVSNARVVYGATPASGGTINFAAFGLVNL